MKAIDAYQTKSGEEERMGLFVTTLARRGLNVLTSLTKSHFWK